MDDEYITHKRGNHGHGLLRINREVEKYGGYINRKNEPEDLRHGNYASFIRPFVHEVLHFVHFFLIRHCFLYNQNEDNDRKGRHYEIQCAQHLSSGLFPNVGL